VLSQARQLATTVAVLYSTSAYAGTSRPADASGQSVQPLATCQQQSFLEGDHYSAVQVAQLAQQAGFSGNDWVIAVAVAEAESAGWTHARLINTDCSVDRGLWQINSFWHGEVSDSCGGSGGTSRIIGYAGKCIDVPGANGVDGQYLNIWDCNGTSAQAWTFPGDGTIRALGKCMDVAWGSAADGAVIQLASCSGNPAQQFWFRWSSATTVGPPR
jgi:hypothetical protein